MNRPERSVAVKRRAIELGFAGVGIATLEPSRHADDLDRWLVALGGAR